MAQKEFSNAEIKRSLKAKSKGDLIKIIKDLAQKIDAQKEHNEDVRNILNDVNSDGGFVDYAFYSMLIDVVDKDV